MSEKIAPWASLAARVVRVALMRKDVGYAELARRLATTFGMHEDEKALASRVALGRVRLALFLQILHVIDAEPPMLWRTAFDVATPWEERAKAVILSEIRQIPPVSIDELAARLTMLGASFTQKTLAAHVTSGNLFLPDFLRCLVILRSRSLDAFIEYRDLVSAAASTPASVD
ncbi:DUF6471 domain-containing protein [Chromobacterium violaceum]|uniref:DUF6471 domain-containing protein n=1 Tax=Chromobacterium violaceum TaxID=536 RepID=UPI001B3343BD|nr:hypothetical protein [Chromobacterium violaceum]